jgi:hypothetical protein
MRYTPVLAMRPSSTPTPEQDYRLLGVPRDASPVAIKRRYLRLVRTCHPDRFFGNTQAQLDAKELMQSFNGAFARVREAPLRARSGPAVSATTVAAVPDQPVAENARPWRADGQRLDPAVREALIASLRMPSVVDVLDASLPPALGIAAVMVLFLGLGRIISGDWSFLALSATLGVCALWLRRGDHVVLAWRRGRARWGR